MPPENIADARGSGLSLARRIYGPRVVGVALAGICVATALWHREIAAWTWLLLGFGALVWPHLAFALSRSSANPRRAEERNLLIDAGIAGFWVFSFYAQPIPTALLLGMPIMDAASVGGLAMLRSAVLASGVGAAVGLVVWGLHFEAHSTALAQWGCIPFLVFYPLLFGTSIFALVRKLDQQRMALRDLSERDALSGVYNRRFFEERIAQEFDHFRRHAKCVSLVMLDIDNFKQINDQHGHSLGDQLIRHVGLILLEQARRADVVSRFGGDEFAVLLPFTDANAALEFVQRVQQAATELTLADTRLGRVSMSFGIALPQPGMDCHDRWIELADAAMYRVKARERGGVEIA